MYPLPVLIHNTEATQNETCQTKFPFPSCRVKIQQFIPALLPMFKDKHTHFLLLQPKDVVTNKTDAIIRQRLINVSVYKCASFVLVCVCV